MKRIFLLLTIVMMAACGTPVQTETTAARVQNRLLALFTACQHKDLKAVRKNLSPDFPEDHLFLQRFLTTFLSRDDLSFVLTSVQMKRQGEKIVANTGFDVSFKRAAGTKDGTKNVVLHKTGSFTLCPDGPALKVCAISPEDILF